MKLISLTRILKGAATGCLLFLTGFGNAQDKVQFVSEEDNTPVSNAVVKFYCDNDIKVMLSDPEGKVSLPDCSLPIIFSIKHLAYSDSGFWNQIPQLVKVKSIEYTIKEADISGFQNDNDDISDVLIVVRRPLPYPAVVGTDLVLTNNFNGASLYNTLNAVPGVRFDERGQGGSRRLNIRGNFVRSAFGVRGIPIYLENIPLTGPEGSSPLEVLDQELFTELKIQKGVSEVSTGAANGGAILAGPMAFYLNGHRISSSLTLGSYNYVRQTNFYQWSNQEHSILFKQIHQETQGYREQESNKKNQFLLQYVKELNSSEKIDFISIYYKGKWDLPGSINQTELEDNREMARPYSILANASVDKLYLLNALSYTINTKKFRHKTSVFINNNDKINPYGTSPFFSGYKDEKSTNFGLRTYSSLNKGSFSTFDFGGEIQNEFGNYQEYFNNEGEKGELKYTNKTNYFSYNIFTNYKRIFSRYILDFGINIQSLSFNNEGYSEVLASALNSTKTFKPVVLPSITLKKPVLTNSYIFILARRGNSWPGLFELVDVETGYINTNLRKENNLVLETGYTGETDNSFFYSANLYGQMLNNPILPGVDTLERISYYNGNETRYLGIEGLVRKEFKPKRLLNSIIVSANGSIQRYYTDKSLDFLAPGVPLSTFGAYIILKHKSGVSAQIMHQYTDKLPLNDSNQNYLSANHILNFNISWNRTIKHFTFEVHGGINNLSNTNYSAFPQLNATFGRFYNPAALQNYFGGLRVTYLVYR